MDTKPVKRSTLPLQPVEVSPDENPQETLASRELAAELTRLEKDEKRDRDRREQERLARERELARFD